MALLHGNVPSARQLMASATYSDEWYTDEETVNKAIGILQPKPRSVIMCPFDSDKSLFVQILKEHGHTVLYGMSNFLETHNYQFDYLITNPPFSLKDAVISQVYKYGKPSLLMLPLDVLGGIKRRTMYAEHGYPFFVIPARRIGYYDQNMVKRPAANFLSVYAVFNTDKSGIDWDNG
jgi:hypothetical protein